MESNSKVEVVFDETDNSRISMSGKDGSDKVCLVGSLVVVLMGRVSKAVDNKGGGGTGKSGKQTRYSIRLHGDSSNDLRTFMPDVIVTGLSHGDVHEGEMQGDKTKSTRVGSGSSNVVHQTDKVLIKELNIVKEPTNVNFSPKNNLNSNALIINVEDLKQKANF
nr:hypothetical protein [Tanacetum cinerariifolium]